VENEDENESNQNNEEE